MYYAGLPQDVMTSVISEHFESATFVYAFDADESNGSHTDYPERAMPFSAVDDHITNLPRAVMQALADYTERRDAVRSELAPAVARAIAIIDNAKNFTALVNAWPEIEATAERALATPSGRNLAAVLKL